MAEFNAKESYESVKDKYDMDEWLDKVIDQLRDEYGVEVIKLIPLDLPEWRPAVSKLRKRHRMMTEDLMKYARSVLDGPEPD